LRLPQHTALGADLYLRFEHLTYNIN
jgi:hypothetical protein